MKKILMISMLFLQMGFASNAVARERLRLEMNDMHSRGQQVIGLRQEIRRQYPRKFLRGNTLIAVRVIAKSRQGGGIARLMVDGIEQDRKRIMGNPGDFNRPRPYTFDRFRLENYGSSNGPWRLRLRGNIKIRRIVVIIDGRAGGGGGGGGGGRGGRVRTVNVSVPLSCYSGTNQTCALNFNLANYAPELRGARVVDMSLNFNYFSFPDRAHYGCQTATTANLNPAKTSDFQQSGGRKALWWNARYSGTNVSLRSGSTGWGSCGGNTCGGCLDYINATVQYRR